MRGPGGNRYTWGVVRGLVLWVVAAASVAEPGTVADATPVAAEVAPAPVGSVEDPNCPAPRPGTLTLATEPWTAVSVDGVVVGTTPLFRFELAAGPHTLTLVNASRGVNVSEDVVIEEGHAHKLKLVLALSAGEAVLNDDHDGADIACIDDDEAAFVTVDTRPWAKVWVDGRLAGVTPLFKFKVSAGAHAVRLMTGAGQVRAVRFTAGAGETVKVVVNLDDAGAGAAAEVAPAVVDPGFGDDNLDVR